MKGNEVLIKIRISKLPVAFVLLSETLTVHFLPVVFVLFSWMPFPTGIFCNNIGRKWNVHSTYNRMDIVSITSGNEVNSTRLSMDRRQCISDMLTGDHFGDRVNREPEEHRTNGFTLLLVTSHLSALLKRMPLSHLWTSPLWSEDAHTCIKYKVAGCLLEFGRHLINSYLGIVVFIVIVILSHLWLFRVLGAHASSP